MIKLDDVTKENMTTQIGLKLAQILDHPYKILNIGYLESLKTNVLMNFTKYHKFILKFMNILKSHSKQNMNF